MSPQTIVDAVVIGSGPNGLVAANALVDAGWDVLILEAQDQVGGAVRSAEVTAPGFSTDPQRTAASVDAFAAGDGQAWLDMFAGWQRIRDPLLDSLFTPFPPVRAAARLLRRLGTAGTLDLARLAVLPVRRLAAENFRGEGAELLLTGENARRDVSTPAAQDHTGSVGERGPRLLVSSHRPDGQV